MSGLSLQLANGLYGALFVVGTCLLLPMNSLRHVKAILAAWPASPLG